MNTVAVPWVPLAAVAAGLAAYAVATRAVPAVVRAALRKRDYRASDLGTFGHVASLSRSSV
jgi:hypothetical protein